MKAIHVHAPVRCLASRTPQSVSVSVRIPYSDADLQSNCAPLHSPVVLVHIACAAGAPPRRTHAMQRTRHFVLLCWALLALCAAAADAPLPNGTAATVAVPPPSSAAEAALPDNEAELHSLLHWALGASRGGAAVGASAALTAARGAQSTQIRASCSAWRARRKLPTPSASSPPAPAPPPCGTPGRTKSLRRSAARSKRCGAHCVRALR